MSQSNALLKTLRQLHLYVGLFISPALLFFALTGALQTFSLHETVRGSDYKPARWIQTLAQLHKKQTTTVPQRKPLPNPAEAQTERPKTDAPVAMAGEASRQPAVSLRMQHLPMKLFFLLVSVGLFVSTLTGIYMAYRYARGKGMVTALLVAGVVVPLLLLLI